MSAQSRHGALARHPALNRMPRDFLESLSFRTTGNDTWTF
jgi:hypothetical protein